MKQSKPFLHIFITAMAVMLLMAGCNTPNSDQPDLILPSQTQGNGETSNPTSVPEPTPISVWTPSSYTDLGALRIATRLSRQNIIFRATAMKLQIGEGLAASDYIERSLLAYAPHWIGDVGATALEGTNYIRVSYVDVYALMKLVWNIDMRSTEYITPENADNLPVINAGDYWYIDYTQSRLVTQVTRSSYQPMASNANAYYCDYIKANSESGTVEVLLSPDTTTGCGFRVVSVLSVELGALPTPTDGGAIGNTDYIALEAESLTYPAQNAFVERILPIRQTAEQFYYDNNELMIAFTLSHYTAYWLDDAGLSLGSKTYVRISHIDIIDFLNSVYETTLGADSYIQSEWTIRLSDGSARPLIWCDDNYWYISPSCEYSVAYSITSSLGAGRFEYSYDPALAGAALGYTKSGVATVSTQPAATKPGVKLGEITLSDVSMHITSYTDITDVDLFNELRNVLIDRAIYTRLAVDSSTYLTNEDRLGYALGLYMHELEDYISDDDTPYVKINHADVMEIAYMVFGSSIGADNMTLLLEDIAYHDGDSWYIRIHNSFAHHYSQLTLINQGAIIYRYSYVYTSPETGRVYDGIVDVNLLSFPNTHSGFGIGSIDIIEHQSTR